MFSVNKKIPTLWSTVPAGNSASHVSHLNRGLLGGIFLSPLNINNGFYLSSMAIYLCYNIRCSYLRTKMPVFYVQMDDGRHFIQPGWIIIISLIFETEHDNTNKKMCTQRRHRSAWASPSLISLHCPLGEDHRLGTKLTTEHSAKASIRQADAHTDQSLRWTCRSLC